jgi:NAD(P)-dependent dehydrogenase (short-subunit alcohol dehydrogenase family)
VAWTQQLHAELADHGIRVQVVCPGVERVGLLQAVFDAELAVFGAQSPTLAERYRAS